VLSLFSHCSLPVAALWEAAGVELHEVIRRRAMVRSFSVDPVAPAVVNALVQAALRAPSAGNTAGTQWVVLAGPAETALYWDATTDAEWRASSARWEGLRRAPVVLLAYSSAAAYVARYGEADKAGGPAAVGPAASSGPASGPGPLRSPDLGADAEEWPVPYWTGDAAFGVMTVLLAAVDAGLGACILGNFRGEAALASALGVPPEWRLFCAVPLGYADGNDHRSPSLSRPAPTAEERVHYTLLHTRSHGRHRPA
jgi:nitroreductase